MIARLASRTIKFEIRRHGRRLSVRQAFAKSSNQDGALRPPRYLFQ
jgi:hypothetical protein